MGREQLIKTLTFGEVMVICAPARQVGAAHTSAVTNVLCRDYTHIQLALAGSGHAGSAYISAQFAVMVEVIELHLPISLLREHGFSPLALADQNLAATPTAVAMRHFLASLTASPTVVSTQAAPSVGRAITEMALAILYEQRGDDPLPLSGRESVRNRATSFIAQRFADPDLGVDHVAAHVSVSRRYIQGVFQDQDSSVGRAIRGLRLDHAAGLLTGQHSSMLSVGKIAALSGFRGPNQLARAFKKTYGMTPRDYREQALGAPARLAACHDG